MLQLLVLVAVVILSSNLCWLSHAFHLNGRKRSQPLVRVAMGGGFGKTSPTGRVAPSTGKKKKKQLVVDEASVGNSAATVRALKHLTPADAKKFCPTLDCEYPNICVRNADPLILEIDDFFPAELCDIYVQRAQEVGKKYNSQTFSASTAAMRTSTTWYLQYAQVPEFLQRAQALTGKKVTTFEEPQIVRYELGQQFSWHYDALPPTMKQNGGQRVATLLVYLNDVKTGGATCFKDYDIQVRPVKGKALLFFPCFADGTPDDRTMHAGQVAGDTKWIAQMWLHESTYEPGIPPDTSHAAGIEAMKDLP